MAIRRMNGLNSMIKLTRNFYVTMEYKLYNSINLELFLTMGRIGEIELIEVLRRGGKGRCPRIYKESQHAPRSSKFVITCSSSQRLIHLSRRSTNLKSKPAPLNIKLNTLCPTFQLLSPNALFHLYRTSIKLLSSQLPSRSSVCPSAACLLAISLLPLQVSRLRNYRANRRADHRTRPSLLLPQHLPQVCLYHRAERNYTALNPQRKR